MPLRIGILSFAHPHANSYASQIQALPGVELAGIADHDTYRADAMAAQYGVPAFPSYRSLLNTGEVDAVIVCSENIQHRELVELSAEYGKAILCEKPLATTIADGEAMIAACENAGVRLYTAFPCRFHPAYTRLRQTVHDGGLGTLLGARTSNHGVKPGGWFTNTDLSGGGAAMDHTVHVVDLLRDLTKSEPVKVYAQINNRINHAAFDDVSLLTITFANGFFATLDGSWSRPKSFWNWGDVTMSLTGTGGTAHLDMFAQSHMVFSDKVGRPAQVNWGDDMDRHLISAFVGAATGGEPPLPLPGGAPPIATGTDGLRATRVALAAYRSAASGEVATI
ncbi:MAG: Gfo/Idh/MocA family oxidoreductase [Fibrella sp.]|nr:Gfo/Idh/MocA family oxidoreductase [Armatimonadota bacterium]